MSSSEEEWIKNLLDGKFTHWIGENIDHNYRLLMARILLVEWELLQKEQENTNKNHRNQSAF